MEVEEITLAEQYFKDIIHRDVVSHYNIRNVKEIRELSLFLITNSGCLTSYEYIKNTIQAKNATTVKNYLNILENVYLISSLSLYDFSLKKQIYNPDKYYVNDLGFYHAVGFKFSENQGKLLENVVFEQLMRKGFEFYYWKSKKGNEVDFLVRQQNKITDAIQVTYSLSTENLARETAGLDALNEQIGAVNKIILTYDEEQEIDTVGGRIKVMPVWKWLLESKEKTIIN
jgi:predicted AAA+ superfamily ATPase